MDAPTAERILALLQEDINWDYLPEQRSGMG